MTWSECKQLIKEDYQRVLATCATGGVYTLPCENTRQRFFLHNILEQNRCLA